MRDRAAFLPAPSPRATTPGLRPSAAVLVCCAATVTAAVTFGPAQPGVVDVELLAANALIMTGTDMHVVDRSWMDMAIRNYIQPTMGGDYTAVPVETPAQFWPFSGPDDMLFDLSVQGGTAAIGAAIAAQGAGAPESGPTVVFGYSQSSIVATATKRRLAEVAAAGSAAPSVSFVMLANPNRPSGGINARFTGAFIEELGWTFSAAAPTDTPFTTVDVAKQYDLFADFPRYPLNLLATANAVVALLYGAHDYTGVTLDPDDHRYDPDTVVQQLGDTTYYFIPTATLPLLQPLRDLGADPVLLNAAEPALRLLVEFGYDRTTPFGQPAPALLTQREGLDQLGRDLTAAVEQGRAMIEAASETQVPPQPAGPTITTLPLRSAAPATTAVPRAKASRAAESARSRAVTQAPARPEPSPASRSRR